MKYIPLLLSIVIFHGCTTGTGDDEALLTAKHAHPAPIIDGSDNDACWKDAEWHMIDKLWIGKLPHASDYMGKFKLSWDSNFLYILAVIYDDTLVDTHANGLEKYWDDDCLEVFVDEDASGGNHQYNYNAFAYHISLNGKWVDIGTDSLPHFFPDHGIMKRTRRDKTDTWEIALRLFPDTYSNQGENHPVLLYKGKTIGFAIAYNDNDGSPERENMIGNIDVKPNPDKNRGWIDAGVFSRLILK